MTFRHGSFVLLIALLGVTASAQEPSNPFGESFWKQWGDGKAELAAYDLVFPRYGETRRGTAVTVFVTEPFSLAARVKADPGKHPDTDVVQVMKLNLIRDFQTGIYDYNLMNSVFVALQQGGGLPPGSVLKSVFSSQEWCGQVYSQLLFNSDAIVHDLSSYFDGEEKRGERIASEAGGTTEDAVLLWARGLSAPFLGPDETRKVPILGSLTDARLKHQPLGWRPATLTRRSEPRQVTVPAGTFETTTRIVQIESGPTWTIDVESAEPHRIVRWVSSSGESGELVGSERVPYWKMNGESFRDEVRKLGLTPRPPRTM